VAKIYISVYNQIAKRFSKFYAVICLNLLFGEINMENLLKTEVGGKTLSIQTGKVAKQASGSVMVQYGETIVLVSVVSAYEDKTVSFLPLTVEYQEKIYAAGRIPGNYFRREIGRPSEKETLTARLVDRPIRPLFPKKI